MIKPMVHLIDDDSSILNSTAAFLTARNFDVKTYASAQAFLATADLSIVGCIVTDVQMDGLSGIELAGKLRERRISVPIIIITAYADIALAIEAMRRGAADLLEKPFSNNVLVKAIHDAMVRWREGLGSTSAELLNSRLADLTSREKDVLSRLLNGTPNKLIAHELGVSTRTVETHRATIMSKMNALSLAELVRMCLAVEPEAPAAQAPSGD